MSMEAASIPAGFSDRPVYELLGVSKTFTRRNVHALDNIDLSLTQGSFSAIIGYEYTTEGANNLHRNIIYRDGKALADQVLPFTSYDSEDAEDLWKWMARYEEAISAYDQALDLQPGMADALVNKATVEALLAQLTRETAG